MMSLVRAQLEALPWTVGQQFFLRAITSRFNYTAPDNLDVKSLQYLMGHSNASVTLDVYTHSSFESVERAFEQIAGNL